MKFHIIVTSLILTIAVVATVSAIRSPKSCNLTKHEKTTKMAIISCNNATR